MPLDVQPLSAGRRAVMLLVLMVLFGGSLGFAALLVRRQPAEVSVDWHLPSGQLKRVPGVALEQVPEGELWSGKVFGRPREVVTIQQDLPAAKNRLTREQVALDLYGLVMGVEPSTQGPATLAGGPAVEVAGTTDGGGFGRVRVVLVGPVAVAICYSGPGDFTDGDRQYWDGLCAHVEIRGAAGQKGK